MDNEPLEKLHSVAKEARAIEEKEQERRLSQGTVSPPGSIGPSASHRGPFESDPSAMQYNQYPAPKDQPPRPTHTKIARSGSENFTPSGVPDARETEETEEKSCSGKHYRSH